MKATLPWVLSAAYLLGCFVVRCSSKSGCSTLQAQEPTVATARITATEPAAISNGNKATLKVRGFKLKEATDLSFPMAPAVKAEIKEKKDAGQPKGLENKLVGDTQLLAEITLPDDFPAGLMEYSIATTAGNANGKILVLAAESVIEEIEPNNGFREAQPMEAGKFLRGSIQGEKDVDVFTFPAKANQQFKVTVTSGGSLLMDAEILCYDFRGQFLAAADDGESRDPALVLKPRTDGPVFVCVSSVHDLGGEWHSYLLLVEEVK